MVFRHSKAKKDGNSFSEQGQRAGRTRSHGGISGMPIDVGIGKTHGEKRPPTFHELLGKVPHCHEEFPHCYMGIEIFLIIWLYYFLTRPNYRFSIFGNMGLVATKPHLFYDIE